MIKICDVCSDEFATWFANGSINKNLCNLCLIKFLLSYDDKEEIHLFKQKVSTPFVKAFRGD